MEPLEIMELARILNALGEKVEIDEEDVQAYFPDLSNSSAMRDFYLPKVTPAFYLGNQKLMRSYRPCSMF